MKCGFSLTALLLCCLSSALAQDCGNEGITVTIDIKLPGSSEGTILIPGNINGPLSLECAVDLDVPGTVSDTKPVITSVVWTKNDEILLDEFTGMMLQISSLQSSDGGMYRCSAVTSLPCTTVQSDATVVTTAPTVSLSPSSNIFAVVGDSVEITCQVEGWPTPLLTWTSNAIDISQNPVLVIDAATIADSGQYSCTADNGETDEEAILTQTITIAITTENTGPVTTPVTSAPTDETTTTSAAPTDGTTTTNAAESVNSNSLGGPVIRPTENGFYIAIAVTAFVCLLLTVITIFAVSIWCYKKHKSERKAEYQEAEYQEEESNTDLQTVETSLM